MTRILSLLALTLLLCSCDEKAEVIRADSTNWKARAATLPVSDSLTTGTTYLSMYSEIYNRSQEQIHGLTATASIRNLNEQDTIYILKADYYDEKGTPIRSYITGPVFIAPMETVDIVINETDREGGAGTKFLFDWATHPNSTEPFFEGVMISTSGQQGLSFTTQGVKVQ